MENLVFAVREHDICFAAVAYFKESGAEGLDLNLNDFAVVEFTDVFLIWMMRAYSDLLAGLEADLGVETEVHVPCLPLVVSDNEEAARRRSAGNGVRRICAAGKKHAVYENVAEAVVQVVYACEDRLLVVAHEPRVCIDLGGEDQAASERLENKIVLEVIDAGGYAHAVILREAEKLRYVAAACEECAVMRRGDEVAHVYVDICFGTLPEEGGRIGHSDSEPEAVVEQYEIGRILAAFLHHLDEQGLMLLSELSAYTVDLELSKVEIAAERYHLLGARLCAFLGVAESVGTAPYSEAGSERPLRSDRSRSDTAS